MLIGSRTPQVITPIILFLAIAIRHTQQAVVDALDAENARSPETATTLDGLRGLRKLVLRRLIAGGAIGTAPVDRFYLDWDGYAVFRKRRRIRAGVALSLVLLLWAMVWWRSSGG